MIRALNALLLHSADVPRLVAFYRDRLGLPLSVSDHGAGPHAEAQLGAVHFAIHPSGPEPSERSGIEFAFEVPDIHAAYEALRAQAVEFQSEPALLPFGGWVAGLVDPDGNRVLLMQWEREG